MNEFEQYLVSNYGLQPGQDIPDDIYDRASAEFLQSRTTVPSIAPNASAFDLDRAIPNAAPSAPAAQPRQQEANPLQGTPFDYGRAVPILEQFASDYIDKENLVRGAKYGDKADIETDWMNAREGIYGPALQELGVTPAKAQIAAISVERGKARNMLEALGIPEQQTSGQQSVGLAPEIQGQIKDAQLIAKNERDYAMNEDLTPEQRLQSKQRAQRAEDQINSLLGMKPKAPYEAWKDIQSTKAEIDRTTNMKGGTVEYQGVPYQFENIGELTGMIDQKEKDLLDQFTQDKRLIPVSRQSTLVYTTDPASGNQVIDAAASQKKYIEALKSASVGEPVELEDGSVVFYEGTQDKKERGSFIPKRLQPAMKGAGVVAGTVAETVAPMLTEENIAAAANTVLPGVGYGAVKTTAAAMRNPQDAAAKLGRAAVTAGTPFGMLAMRGLDYLSEVGRKAEEEEKKKLAGQ